MKRLSRLHHWEERHRFSWELQRAARALVCHTSSIRSCGLQDCAEIQDSALSALSRPSPLFILIAQILKRLQQQRYRRRTKPCIYIPTRYMRCMFQYSAVSTKTVASPSSTNKTGHYKSILSLYSQCMVQTWTNFQVIYDATKYLRNIELIKLIIGDTGFNKDSATCTHWDSQAQRVPEPRTSRCSRCVQ